jgi:hypothetical protein
MHYKMPSTQITRKIQSAKNYRDYYYRDTPVALMPPEICDMITEYLLDEEAGYELCNVSLHAHIKCHYTEFTIQRFRWHSYKSSVYFNLSRDQSVEKRKLLDDIGESKDFMEYDVPTHKISSVVIDTHLKTVTFKYNKTSAKFTISANQCTDVVRQLEANIDSINENGR